MRWLQLCDLHLGKEDDGQSVAMAQLIQAVGESVGDEPLDFIVFAGDLAYSGRKEEYQAVVTEIVEPLRQLPAAANAILVSVPGNHDLDCNGTLPITWDRLGQTRQNIFWNTDEGGPKITFEQG